MDDLFNDDVPPPDSQSNPEQETDNDEVSHDDVPDKIPSSGLDTILDFNEEDNRLLEQLKREKRSLSSYDGFLESELSHRRIPYHIIRIDNTPWDVGQAHYLALLGARLSCDVIDIFRGRRKPAHVERILTEDCMRRLKTASGLLINHMKGISGFTPDSACCPSTCSWSADGWFRRRNSNAPRCSTSVNCD